MIIGPIFCTPDGFYAALDAFKFSTAVTPLWYRTLNSRTALSLNHITAQLLRIAKK